MHLLRNRCARATLSLCLAVSAGTFTLSRALADDVEDNNSVELAAQVEPLDPPLADEPPELPEVPVQGRGVYPAEPLPDDVAISPTRTETRIGQTGTALTVITEEEIKNSGKSSVAEVLRGKVGLDVVRSGPLGGQTSVFLRGANSQQTKVLLDGIPLNDPSSATRGFDFSSLDVENIERIEILRGAQSLLYGSDAIGGVINIITKRGSGPTTPRASAYGGSLGTGRIGGGASGGDEQKYYSIGGSYLSTDGVSVATGANREKDGFKNGTLSGRFGYTPADEVNIDYVFRYNNATAQVDDFDFFSGLPTDNLIRENLLDSFANRVQMQSLFMNGGVEQIIGFSLVDYRREDTDTGSPFVPPKFQGQSRTVDGLWNLLLTEENTFSVGAQHYTEDASSTFDPEASQHNFGIFLQDQWQILPNWYLGVGTRWDDNSRAGPAETYRANSLYTVVETDTDFHGSIGTGFRAPALAENIFFFNPNLLPEQSKGWDVGATQRLCGGVVTFDATYFRNDFTDLIVFDFNTFGLVNVGRARASGVEVTGQWLADEDTTFTANYTLTDTLNLDTGTELLRRPRDKAQVGIDRYFACRTVRVGAQMLYVGDRLDTGNRILDDYILLNVNGSYYVNERAELFARIDNVTDERYEEVRGFGVPGIAGYAGVNMTW